MRPCVIIAGVDFASMIDGVKFATKRLWGNKDGLIWTRDVVAPVAFDVDNGWTVDDVEQPPPVVPENAFLCAIAACLKCGREREFVLCAYRADLDQPFAHVQRRLVSWIGKEYDTGRVDEIRCGMRCASIPCGIPCSEGLSSCREDFRCYQIGSIQGFPWDSKIAFHKGIRCVRIGEPVVRVAGKNFNGPSTI